MKRETVFSELQERETARGGALKEPDGSGYSLQCVAAKIYEYRSGEM